VVGLTFAMLRSQWSQALTVFLLALLAVAAAVAAPVYADMAGRAIAAADVAAAPNSQRTITAADNVVVRASGDSQTDLDLVANSQRRDFEHVAPPLLVTPGFGTALSVSFPAYVTPVGVAIGDKNGSLDYREDFCAHVIVITGRCVAAPGEVLVSEARAKAAGLATNATVAMTPATFVSGGNGLPGFWVPDGPACALAVVGIYRPRAPTEPYWGRAGADFATVGAEPVLTDRRTVASCVHNTEQQEVVAYPLPGTLTVDQVAAVRAAVQSTMDQARGRVPVSSNIAGLLATIESDRAAVARVPTTAAVPLLALCWFVLFLAIAYTAQSRRRELGIVKLRGVSSGDQWWLAAAESLVPVLAGSVVGYAIGHLGVLLYGRSVFGADASVRLSAGPWLYATLAVAGAVVAAAIALRRDLAANATDLLRQVPTRGARWGEATLGALLAVAAVVAVVQLRSEPPETTAPGGLALLAPALLLMSLGLLAAAALDPVAARVGVWSLHKGRIGLALAALHLGRRRAGSRLLAIVVVATGLLAFAATAATVAAQARRDQVALDIGATRVLGISEVRPAALLRVVREVDPDGRYAMAVVPVDPGPAGRRVLAVDASRLATASQWPAAAGMSASAAATALRPAVPGPVVVRGGPVSVTVDAEQVNVRTPDTSLRLRVTAAPLDGSTALTYDLGPLRAGLHSYVGDLSCADGCRIAAIGIAPSGAVDGDFQVTIQSVDQAGAPLVSAAQLGGWLNRDPGTLQAQPSAAGMRLSARSSLFAAGGMALLAPDAPIPLPVLDASGLPLSTLELANGERIAATAVGSPRALPRLGNVGALADLEYLTRYGDLTVASRQGEVWLGPDAPADAAQRFQAAGLTVTSERRLDDQLAATARRPSATGIRFLLVAAALGLLLGVAGMFVAAGAERSPRAAEVRALRAQGLPRVRARTAALVGYAGVVGVAGVIGALTGTLVWALTGDRLPLVDVRGPGLIIPPVPGLAAIAGWAAGSALLVVLALGFSAALARTIERSPSARQE